MQIDYHKNFKKQYKKLSLQLQKKVNERLELFTEEPFNQLLHNHALNGVYFGYRSISITGDFRALYKLTDLGTVIFVDIDTQSNLYS